MSQALRAPQPVRVLTVSFAIGITAVLIGVGIGMERLEAALLPVLGIVAAVVLPRLSLASWGILLLILSITSRGLVALFGLPPIVSYLHYPAAVVFAVVASARPREAEGRGSRAPTRWLVGLLFMCLFAMVANFSHPMRALIFIVIVGEPLLIMWAISRWGEDRVGLRRLAVVGALLMFLQVPIGVVQALTIGFADPVQGTLVGHGAGAHVLGGLFGLTLFVSVGGLVARRISPPAAAVGICVSVGMILIANAIQVLIAAAFALILVPLFVPMRESDVSQRVSARFGVVLVGLALTLTAATSSLYLAEAMIPGILTRAQKLARVEELPERQLIEFRARVDPGALVIGSGPGTTASRASLLLTPTLLKETSPLAALDLPPTDVGLGISGLSRNPAYGGSAESFASSVVGIIGDLGLLGVAATAWLFVAIWRELGRWRNWLMTTGRAILLMSVILSFIDNWLEYPEFTVPLGMILGLALRPEESQEPPTDASSPFSQR